MANDPTTPILRAAYSRAFRIRFGGHPVHIGRAFPYPVTIAGQSFGCLADCISRNDEQTGNIRVFHRDVFIATIHAPAIALGRVR